MFRLVAVPHPFKNERTIRELEPGPTIRDLVEKIQPIPELQHAHVLIGDEPIPESEWDARRPEDGDLVIIRIIPAGSAEGGAKAAGWLGVLAIITGIVLLFVPGAAGLGLNLIVMGGGLAAGGFGVYTVLNLLSPMGELEREESPPSIRGARNQANPWGSVPVILGKHLVVPPYGSLPYTEIVGEDQYLRLLFIFGYSTLTVEDLKIGDTLLGEYDDVEYEILQDSTPSTLFPDQIIEDTLNILLEQSAGGQMQTTELDTDEVSVDITFPQGLVQFEDDGDKTSLTVVVTCEYSPTGENDWTLFHTFTITAKQQKTLRYGKRYTLPSRGQYDIRLTRTTADRTGDKQFDKVYWTALRSITDEDPVAESIREKVVRVAMRIRATDQLSGVVDQFNTVCTSRIPVYSGSGSGADQWTTVEASQNPAALLLYMLRGEPNPKPVPDDRIDWPAFEAWYQWCASSGHTCNAVHGRGEALRTILNKIASTGRASISVRDGKYSVIYDIERTTVIQLFTPRNSWGFEGQKAFIDPPHALKLRFISEPAGWQQDEIIVYDDGYSADGAGETEVATEFKTVEIWGITDPDQLWQDGRYQIAAIKLRPEIYSFYADVESIVCQRGDLIRVQHDVPLLGISSGRIKSLTTDGEDNVLAMSGDETFLMVGGQSYAVRIRKADGTYLEEAVDTEAGEQTEVTFTTPIPAAEAPAIGDLYSFGLQDLETVEMVVVGIEMGEDLEAKIYCVDYSPDIYDADTGEIPEYDPQVTLPADYQEAPPTPVIVEVRSNETVMLASGHDFVTQLFVSLAPGGAGTVYTERYEVQLRQNGTQDLWVSFSVPATNPSLVIGDVVAGATYDIRARALSPEGVPSEWATTIHDVVTPPAPASPTYVELQNGYTTGGGTKTPTVPTITECRAIGLAAIALYWDRQNDLTNFDHYDVQVSSDQSNWYVLRNDGVDWKGAIDEFTSVDIEYIVHENIPPGGTEDNPTALTLYYKVRRVTKASVASNYSTAASATMNLLTKNLVTALIISAAKITANTITADKLNVNALAAQFANIAYALTVGYAGSGTPGSPVDGDTRIYIDGDEIGLQKYVTSAWVDQARIYANAAVTAMWVKDDGKISLGAAADLRLYHQSSGSYSIIEHSNAAGPLLVKSKQNFMVWIGSTQVVLDAVKDAGVSLFYNASLRFATVSTGAKVTGDLEVTGEIIGGGGVGLDLLEALKNPITSTSYTTPGETALTLNTSYTYALLMCIGAAGAGGAVDYPNAGANGGAGGSSGVKNSAGTSWYCEAKGGNGGYGNPKSQRGGAGAAIPSGGSGGKLAIQYPGMDGYSPSAGQGTGGYGAGTSPIAELSFAGLHSLIPPPDTHLAGNTIVNENGNGIAGNSPGGGGQAAAYDHATYYAGAGGGSAGQVRLYCVRITGQSLKIVVGTGGTCPSGAQDRYGGPGANGAVYLLYA